MKRPHKLWRINAEKFNKWKMICDFSKNISSTNISVDYIILISVLLGLIQSLIHGIKVWYMIGMQHFC